MGPRAKIKREILRETVIGGCDFNLGTTLVQAKESCKGVSIYKLYKGFEYDEEFSELKEFYATHSKEEADRIFSRLESRYLDEELIRKIF